MIVGNALKFGYGDIAVRASSTCQQIRFAQIRDSKRCGEQIGDSRDLELVGRFIRLELQDLSEYGAFMALLHLVGKEINSFEFKGYVFDFSKFNYESVKVVERAANNAIYEYLVASAS